MTDRDILGTADPGDAVIAHLLGADEVRDVRVEVVEYGLEMMTTGGRWWVNGQVVRSGHVEPFRIFVKLARTVARSPVMAYIPPQLHERTIRDLPWQVEPDVYRSELTDHLPPGTRAPRCLGVVDVDDDSAAIWLEAVDHVPGPWDDTDYVAAAEALGRLATDAAIADVAARIGHPVGPRQARTYWEGRLTHQFAIAYRGDELWQHPAVAAQVDAAMRGRILALLDAVPDLLTEIEALPLVTSHGDYCPNNILRSNSGLVLIDWSFFARNRLGFDLSQLVWSQIDLGLSPGADLPRLQSLCLDAYRAGLAVGGIEIEPAALRRAHDIQLALANGIAAIPLERLGDDPSTLEPLLHERLVALDHVLTALDL